MTKDEMKTRLETIEAEAKALREALEQKKDPRWRANVSEEFIYLNHATTTMKTTDDRGQIDNTLFNFGNYFQTREQAERHAERQEVFNLIWAYHRALYGDEVIHTGFMIQIDDGELVFQTWSKEYGMPKFKTKEDAKQVVAWIGEQKIKRAWR